MQDQYGETGRTASNWIKDVKHIKLDKDGNYCGYLGVSENSGTPKWMVYKGKPY